MFVGLLEELEANSSDIVFGIDFTSLEEVFL